MQDSQIGGTKGPGQVDPRRLASENEWGRLPPKKRQESLQGIAKDFPGHYREVIEGYFRRLAREGR